MELETVKAKDVRIGDEIMMPNSRRAQKVDDARDNKHPSNADETVIELRCGDATLVLGPDDDVRKLVKV